MTGLSEEFNEAQRFGLGVLVAQVRNQVTDEFLLGARSLGGWFAQVFQNLRFHCLQVSNLSFGFCCWLCHGGCGRRRCRRWFGCCREREPVEILVTASANVLAAQMFNKRVEPGIFGDDVEVTSRIGNHGTANVIAEGEIKGVLTHRSQADQFHGGRVVQEFFHQGHIKLSLP